MAEYRVTTCSAVLAAMLACSHAGEKDSDPRGEQPIVVTRHKPVVAENADAAPVLAFATTSPASVVTESTPQIAWVARESATHYDVIISLKSDCRSSIQLFTGITATETRAAKLPEGTYYVCLLATLADASIVKAENSPFEFRVDLTPPGRPVLDAASPTQSTAQIVVQWQSAEGAVAYRVKVAKDGACTQVELDKVGISETKYETRDFPDGLYFICLSAIDDAGLETPAERVRSVTIDSRVPRVTNVTTDRESGPLKVGDVITILVEFSEAPRVDLAASGVAPRVLLETGSADRFANFVGSVGSQMSFRYVVELGDDVTALDISRDFPKIQIGSATIRDESGLDADLSLPYGTQRGSLRGNRSFL